MSLSSKRILLIEPPFHRLYKDTYSLTRYPLSLGYLASSIKANTNWDVRVFNAEFSPSLEEPKIRYLSGRGFEKYLKSLSTYKGIVWDKIRSVISEYQPDIVGLTIKSPKLASALIVAQIAKQINPNIIVIAGGPHPTLAKGDLFRFPEIDVSIIGEGERTIVELLQEIEQNNIPDHVKGIVFRDGDNIIHNPIRPFIENLDNQISPYKYIKQVLIDFEQYPISAFRNIISTRGCPHDCLPCASRELWTRRVRFRSPNNIVEEIHLLQMIGIKQVHFDDDTFGVNQKYLTDLCNTLIEKCPSIKWGCEIRVDLINEQTVALMKKAGCISIQLGVESGNDQILHSIGKEITIAQSLEACVIIKKHKIELKIFIMIGVPEETEKSLKDTIIAIKKVRPDEIIYSIFTPYLYTEAFELCQKSGLIPNDYDPSFFNHQSRLNYFSKNISPHKFRKLASKIERLVDRRNYMHQLHKLFYRSSIIKAREIGIGHTIQKIKNLLLGK